VTPKDAKLPKTRPQLHIVTFGSPPIDGATQCDVVPDQPRKRKSPLGTFVTFEPASASGAQQRTPMVHKISKSVTADGFVHIVGETQ
jgi:hypothetical protein